MSIRIQHHALKLDKNPISLRVSRLSSSLPQKFTQTPLTDTFDLSSGKIIGWQVRIVYGKAFIEES